MAKKALMRAAKVLNRNDEKKVKIPGATVAWGGSMCTVVVGAEGSAKSSLWPNSDDRTSLSCIEEGRGRGG